MMSSPSSRHPMRWRWRPGLWPSPGPAISTPRRCAPTLLKRPSRSSSGWARSSTRCALLPRRSMRGLLQGNPDFAVVVGVANVPARIDLQLRTIGMLPARGGEPLAKNALHQPLDRLGNRSARLEDAPRRGRHRDVAATVRQGRAIGRGFNGNEVRELPAFHVEFGTNAGDIYGAPCRGGLPQPVHGPVAQAAIPQCRDVLEGSPAHGRADRHAGQREGGLGLDAILHGMRSFERDREGNRWIGAETGARLARLARRAAEQLAEGFGEGIGRVISVAQGYIDDLGVARG